MTDIQQPQRWLERDDEWRRVAQGLQSASSEAGPTDEQRARMQAALLSQLDAQEHSSAEVEAEPQPSSAKMSSRPWLKLGAVLTLVGLGFLLHGLQGAPVVPPKVVPPKVVPPKVVPPKVVPPKAVPPQTLSVAPSSEPRVQAEQQASEPTAPPLESKRKRRPAKAVAALPDAPEVPATDPASELSLLMRARRVLLSDPLRSLELVAQHARDYPRGAFAEEREVLAIEALQRAGQREASARRLRAFERAFPDSTHLTRLRALSE